MTTSVGAVIRAQSSRRSMRRDQPSARRHARQRQRAPSRRCRAASATNRPVAPADGKCRVAARAAAATAIRRGTADRTATARARTVDAAAADATSVPASTRERAPSVRSGMPRGEPKRDKAAEGDAADHGASMPTCVEHRIDLLDEVVDAPGRIESDRRTPRSPHSGNVMTRNDRRARRSPGACTPIGPGCRESATIGSASAASLLHRSCPGVHSVPQRSSRSSACAGSARASCARRTA